MPAQLDAALAYAASGWSVFPVQPGSKKPYPRSRGFKDATLDAATIRRWWSAAPDALIGHPTGHGVFVLDVDDPTVLSGLQSDPPALPPTVEAQTPRPGHHFFYAAAGPVKTVAPIPGHPGLDVRGDGGYVVLPSPLDPGREWVRDPAFCEIAPAPAWLLDLLSKPAERSPARSAPGGRNCDLASLAGTMRRAGFCAEAITAALLAENPSRCDPPLADDEVRSVARSIARYAPTQEVGASFEELTGLLGLDTVGRSVVEVASYGPRGGRSDVYLRLDDASQVSLCPLSAYLTPSKLSCEIAAQTGATVAFKFEHVLRFAALIRGLSSHEESVELAGRAHDLGADYLREAAVAEVSMSDQAERYRAFERLSQDDQLIRAGGRTHVVLLDADSGTRYVRAQWLKDYLRGRSDAGEPGPMLRELERSGWSQPGREGRVKATSPGMGAPLQWSFWLIPAGWENR